MTTYSLDQYAAAISAPTLQNAIAFGDDSNENVRVSLTQSAGATTFGADGSLQHTLYAGKPARVTAQLLSSSPVNGLLRQLYNNQSASSQEWGHNTITICRRAGDEPPIICTDVAFVNSGGQGQWEFDAGSVAP